MLKTPWLVAVPSVCLTAAVFPCTWRYFCNPWNCIVLPSLSQWGYRRRQRNGKWHCLSLHLVSRRIDVQLCLFSCFRTESVSLGPMIQCQPVLVSPLFITKMHGILHLPWAQRTTFESFRNVHDFSLCTSDSIRGCSDSLLYLERNCLQR